MIKPKVNYPRRAIATLELVLVIPIVLVLMVGLVWLGYSVIGQAEVTVKARHDAWGQRFDAWRGQPFGFDQDDVAEAESNKEITVTPLLSNETGPSAKFSIEKGPWDYRQLEFESMFNVKVAIEMSVAAKTMGIAGSIDDLQAALAELRGAGQASLTQAMQEIFRELTNPQSLFEAGANSGKQRAELDEQLAKEKIEGALADLRTELDDVRTRQDAAGEDEDLKWLLEQQENRIKIQIKLLEQV